MGNLEYCFPTVGIWRPLAGVVCAILLMSSFFEGGRPDDGYHVNT
jgi:hypothetical protein